MCLRFVFLLITRTASWLRLSQREETWKTAEILILRHQLAVLQRRQPRRPGLDWAERALLAILLAVIPKARRQGLRLLVTPDTIVRWHRDIVRRVRRRPRRCRDPDRALQRPDASDERDRRTLDRRMPSRDPRPDPHLEPGPSAAAPAPVRDPPQSAPAAPVTKVRCATEAAT